jgi:long-chain fatty acid transport protein
MRRQILTLFIIMLPFSPAFAAGYGLNEQSAAAMGSAYAGAAAGAEDASYLPYNPAAAAATTSGDVTVSAVSIMPSSSANYTTALTAAGTPVSGNKQPSGFIRNAIIPDLAWRERLSDRWSVGMSISVPWGLASIYPTTGAGRYYGDETKLLTIDATPVVAYDIAPNITIAGGFQAQYAKGTLTTAVDIGTIGALYHIPGSVPGAMDGSTLINAHSWAYGFVLGGRAVLDDGWTVGLSYRSAVHHTLKGPWTFTLDSAGVGAAIKGATGLFSPTIARAKLTTPDELEFGVRKKIDDRWTALMEVNWTGWSSFNMLNIVAANPVQPTDVTDEQYKDAVLVALGAEYAMDDRWTFRVGTAYDGTPIPDATLATHIPDANRFWVAAGLTYHATDTIDIKASIGHLSNDSRTINQTAAMTGNALRGTLIGTTNSSVTVLGLALTYNLQN